MAVDIFLKIDGIDGESKEAAHRDWIEVSSWNWGVQQVTTPRDGAGAGKVSVQDLTITKSLDKASPALMQSCATGRRMKEVTLDLTRQKNDRQTYFTVKLSDVLVSSYKAGSAADRPDNQPREEITLSFIKIEMIYNEIDCNTNKVTGEHRASYFLKIQ